MLDKLLNRIEKVESCIFTSIKDSKYNFNQNDMKFLNNFGDEVEKTKELANVISNNAYNNFTDSLRASSISLSMRNLYVQLASELNTSTGSFYERILNPKDIADLKSIAGTIIDFKPAIKKLKRQHDEYLEIENSNSIFDETKIDKKQVLIYIKQSLEELKKETIIPEKEKEKLIIIYKEVIKEVEKKQTNWQKVLGFFNVIAIACTLYTSAPVIKDDIIKASKEISKGVRIVPGQTEPKIKVLENQAILIDIKQS